MRAGCRQSHFYASITQTLFNRVYAMFFTEACGDRTRRILFWDREPFEGYDYILEKSAGMMTDTFAGACSSRLSKLVGFIGARVIESQMDG